MKAYYIRYIENGLEDWEIIEAGNEEEATFILSQCEPLPVEPLEIVGVIEFSDLSTAIPFSSQIETFCVTSKAPRCCKNYNFKTLKEATAFCEKKNQQKTKYGYYIRCCDKRGYPLKVIGY